MPILRTKEIRSMSQPDRQKRLGELQTELMRLKTMVKAGGQVENPARVHELRKTIARIHTINTEPTPIKKEKEKEKPKEKKEDKKKKQQEQKKEKEKKPKKTTKPKEGTEQ